MCACSMLDKQEQLMHGDDTDNYVYTIDRNDNKDVGIDVYLMIWRRI